jgi:hypothetical protein
MSTMISDQVFFCISQGYFGVGPKGLATGDTAIVVAGLRMPFVVRKQPNSNIRTFIGPVYVHSIMQSEAFQFEGETDLERFIIG